MLQLDGLSCLACVTLLEGLLSRQEGLVEAHVSHASGRTRLAWQTETTDLGTLLGPVEALGYRARPLAAPAPVDLALLWRLGFACFAAANLMMVHAALYLGWLEGMDPAWSRLLQWTSLALATPVALWCASPFHQRALAGLRARVLHMDLPISLAVSITWLHGIAATLAGREGFLDSLGMLVVLLLAGRWLQERTRRQRGAAAEALAARLPRRARRLGPQGLEEVDATSLEPGDRLEVASGEVVAADGRILAGRGLVQRALLTGEATPVASAPGDRVQAGTVLVEGHLQVLVDRSGSSTLLGRMEQTLAGLGVRGEAPSPAERLAPAFTAATLGLATAGGLAWWSRGGVEAGLEVAVAVLVVACPCALALSGPLSALAGIAASSRQGLLVRSADALRRLANVDTVALDKTGTLTTGRLRVLSADDEVLRIAAGLERASIHPIARAILDEARERGLPLPQATGVVEEPGRGISGRIDGQHRVLRAGTPGEVQVEGLGTVNLGDRLRPETPGVVAALRDLGLEPTLLSGDQDAVAEGIAEAAGIDRVLAGADPEEKLAWLRDRQDLGQRVLFVGDGLNDGPALAAATVGIAMAEGAPSSVLAADAVAVRDGLRPVLGGLRASRSAEAARRRALVGALVYNSAGVVAALAGVVNPLVAALLMPLSNAWVLWVCGRPLRETP